MNIVESEHNNHEINNNVKKRIFFNLKQHSLIQKVLIDTLLIRANCIIDDLAIILHTDKDKLHRVWQGKDQLSGKESDELVGLFYILSN